MVNRCGCAAADASSTRAPLAQLQRFEIGKAYPCWWSVRDRNELLLEPRQRAVRRRVFFTVVAVVLILLPGWMEASVRRRRRR